MSVFLSVPKNLTKQWFFFTNKPYASPVELFLTTLAKGTFIAPFWNYFQKNVL